jgi:hypothetical protein
MFASPGGGCRELTLRGNVFSHGPGRKAAEIHRCQGVDVTENLFYGEVEYEKPGGGVEAGGQFQDEFPENRYLGDRGRPPSETLAFVRLNAYDPNRAHVIVYNWGMQCRVEVDVTSLNIPRGARYELRNVQDYFGQPLRGVYRGRELKVPMTGWPLARPTGGFEGALPATLPEFGVFVLTWRVTPWSYHRSRLLSLRRDPQHFPPAVSFCGG